MMSMSQIDDDVKKSFLGKIGLQLMPSSVRDAVIEDVDFLNEVGLQQEVDAVISFGDGVAFSLRKLVSVIKSIDSMSGSALLDDKKGRAWEVSLKKSVGSVTSAVLSDGNATLEYPSAALFLGDVEDRSRSLDLMIGNCGLPQEDYDRWKCLVFSGPIACEQIAEIYQDIEDTPARFMSRMSTCIRSGDGRSDIWIPASRRYFERLVGDIGASKTVAEHVNCGARKRIEELVRWDNKKGLLYSLPLSSYSAFSDVLPLQELSDETINEVYEFLIIQGDMLSKVAFIEAMMSVVSTRPHSHELVANIIQSLLDEDVESSCNGFLVLSRLFMLVDSELSTRGSFRDCPPFYRRQAAFAHASLIQRQFNIEDATPGAICEWVENNRGYQFYLQTVADMRLEPRWDPDLVDSAQLKQEFLGRLLNVAEKFKGDIPEGRLTELLLGSKKCEAGLAAHVVHLRPYYPGPLEGSLPPRSELPASLRIEIDKQLKEEVGLSSFAAVITLANVFEFDADISAQLANMLKEKRQYLRSVSNENEIFVVLTGLAKVAAVTRCTELAHEVRVLVGKHRGVSHSQLPIVYALGVLLISAASNSELNEWLYFVRQSFEDLAFGNLQKEEARQLHGCLKMACTAVPDLWLVTGGVEAALSAYVKS